MSKRISNDQSQVLVGGNDVYKPSEMLVNLAKNGQKLNESPQKADRKEKLGFEMSSVANNF